MLNQLLSSFHLSATVFHRSFFHRTLVCDSWSTDTSGNGHANFHLISSGKAYLHSNQHNGTLLNAGDMVLFIRDSAHLLSYSPEAQLSNAAENEPSQFIAYPMEVPLENSTGLICGYFDFGSDQQHPVLQQFRDCLVITKAQQIGAIKSLVQSIISESHLGAHANDVILSRLSEVFFLALLRQLAESPTTEMGLFYALQDPKMAMVLQHMYRQIGAPWTLESLAASGGYSRASFVSYFNRYLNQAPLAFLTHLRLTQAKKQLQRGDTVIKVALDVGYQSDVSFAKAYKRYFGIGPGADRL